MDSKYIMMLKAFDNMELRDSAKDLADDKLFCQQHEIQ